MANGGHLGFQAESASHGRFDFKPSRCIKASLILSESRLISLQLRSFRRKIPTKLFYQHMAKLAIFCIFSPTLSHLYPLHVENCDSNTRLVVDKDDNGKFRLERVKEELHEISIDLASWLS